MKKEASATDNQWKRWGEFNPYHGVLCGFDTKLMDDPERKTSFFELGESDIDKFLSYAYERYPGFESNKGSAIDFGCGVGRLVRPLASRFDHVVGVDISPEMLRLARENTKEFPNVEFYSNIAEINPDIRFSFVHTFIVMQHIRPDQGMSILNEMMNLVAPQGVFCLHFLVRDRIFGRKILNWFRYRLPPLHWAYNILKGRPLLEPLTEMNVYDLSEVVKMAEMNQFVDVHVGIKTDHGGHLGVHLYGRKSGA